MSGFSYRPRPVTFLELWRHDGWRMKIYGIAYGRPRPGPEFVKRAKEIAKDVLSGVSDHYGVGFVGLHQGKTGNFIFIDWWAQENELHHHVFVSPPEAPLDFTDRTATGLTACVWDLAVMNYEREAWVETAMKTGGEAGFDAYLSRRLEGDV